MRVFLLTSVLIKFWRQSLGLQGLSNLVGNIGRARSIVLQLVALRREAVVVVEQRVLLAIGNGRIALRPVSGDEDDGTRLLWCAQLQDIWNLFPHGLDEVGVLRVAEDGHGPATVGDADDRSARHVCGRLIGGEVEGLLLDVGCCCGGQERSAEG